MENMLKHLFTHQSLSTVSVLYSKSTAAADAAAGGVTSIHIQVRLDCSIVCLSIFSYNNGLSIIKLLMQQTFTTRQ